MTENTTARGSTPSIPARKDSDVCHVDKPDEEALDDVSPEQHAKTFRKVDWHLMPMLMALYLISNLDR